METVAVSSAEAGVATRTSAPATPTAPAARPNERIVLTGMSLSGADGACHPCFPRLCTTGCRSTGTFREREDRAVTTDRDRDVEGRARNARPRDALGRPLPYGT